MTKKLLLLSLLAAGGLSACADYPAYYGPPPGHVRWCLNHHPGYDPATNLFPGADGQPHVCRVHPARFYGPPPPPPPPGPPPPPPAY